MIGNILRAAMATDEVFLKARADALFSTNFEQRDGRVVPTTADMMLKDGAVKIEAAFLYADLAGSAYLSKICPWTTTAKIIRAYLDCATRLIIKHGGHVRSFDGHRVMGIFMGDTKNSSASNCGREIHWAVRKIIQPAAFKQFKSISGNGIKIGNCSGVDVGEVRAVRSGIRDNNDLIWIGKAASFSAKLSDVRDPGYSTYISSRVYKRLNQTAKFDSDEKSLWTFASFVFAGEGEAVYKSNNWKKPLVLKTYRDGQRLYDRFGWAVSAPRTSPFKAERFPAALPMFGLAESRRATLRRYVTILQKLRSRELFARHPDEPARIVIEYRAFHPPPSGQRMRAATAGRQMMDDKALFSECAYCKGTGHHFDTPDYRWTGLAYEGDGNCSKCGGLGLLLSDDGKRLRALFDALKNYPKRRSPF